MNVSISRRRMAFLAPVAALAVATVVYAAAAAGDFDPGFGTGGVTATDYGPYGNAPYDMAVQTDGKVVVGGTDGMAPPHWLVRRFNGDGTSDTSFGTGGSVAVFADVGGMLHDLTLDSSGRILATGSKGYGGYGAPPPRSVLVRFNGDGTLDTSFGTGGTVTTTLGSGNSEGRAVAVQSDGKILAAGNLLVAATKKTTANTAIYLARYSDSGALDTGFGAGGVTTNNLTSKNDSVYPSAMGLQSDGKIVLGGTAGTVSWSITRYQANGLVDSAFGWVQNSSRMLHGLSVDASDRILASGLNGTLLVTRYAANGTVDTLFGTAGTAAISMTGGYANPLCLPDGGIVLVGQVTPVALLPSWTQAQAVRLLSTGALDTGFGTGGYSAPIDVFPTMTAYADRNEPMGLAAAADGGILVTGRATGSTGTAVSTRHIAWFLGKILSN